MTQASRPALYLSVSRHLLPGEAYRFVPRRERIGRRSAEPRRTFDVLIEARVSLASLAHNRLDRRKAMVPIARMTFVIGRLRPKCRLALGTYLSCINMY